ncbi:MAG TPA: type II toxin-antitoxin system HicB family antitoxin [Longimicrobium sp.]|jgi:predicted RNase H-like HicB family nuclease
MTRDMQHYLRLPYTTRVAPDQGTRGERLFLASVEELPGCQSHGDTPEEALLNLKDAMELYIGSMLEDGIEPPEPRGEPVSWGVKTDRPSAA